MIEDILIDGDGELTPETEARMDALLQSGVPKIEGAVLIVKELEATAERIKLEADRMTKRRQSFERNADSLKARIVMALDAAFNGKIKTDRITAYTQKSKDSIVFEFKAEDSSLENLHHAHPELVKVETVYSLDKEALLKKWEEEAPLREQFAMELEAFHAEVGATEDMGQPTTALYPCEPESAIPAVVEVTETPGKRFLQVR